MSASEKEQPVRSKVRTCLKDSISMSVDVLTLYPQLTGPYLPGFSSCTKSCGCREESPCNDGRAPVHKLDVQSSLNIASVIWSYVHTPVGIGRYLVHHRPVVPWGAGGAMAPSEFGRSVNPISTKGADYADNNTTCPPTVFQTFLRP